MRLRDDRRRFEPLQTVFRNRHLSWIDFPTGQRKKRHHQPQSPAVPEQKPEVLEHGRRAFVAKVHLSGFLLGCVDPRLYAHLAPPDVSAVGLRGLEAGKPIDRESCVAFGSETQS